MSLLVHASCVVLGEDGYLIVGESGAGKSRLALALCHEARRNGRFARLVGDDRIAVAASGGRLIARPHPALAGLIEVRGIGLVPTSHEPSARIRLVIALVPDLPDRMPHGMAHRILCGIRLPELVLWQNGAADDACRAVAQFRRIHPD